VLLYQLVFLNRGGEAVKIAKRSGEFVELDELIDDVGADAARFFFLLRSPGAQMDFDLDLAKKQSADIQSFMCSTPTRAFAPSSNVPPRRA